MLTLFSPIFIDISNLKLVLFGDYEPVSAVHVGYLVIGVLMLFNLLQSILLNRIDQSFVYRLLIFFILFTASLLFSEASFLIGLQFLSLIIYFPYAIKCIGKKIVYLYSFSIILNTAFLIIYISVNLVFREIYDPFRIYQGLVSFPAILILYIYALLCFLPLEVKKRHYHMMLLITLQIGMCIYLVLDAGRKVGLIDILILFGVIIYSVIYYNVRTYRGQWLAGKRSLLFFPILFIPIFYNAITAFVDSNLMQRLIGASLANDLDGSRLSNWSDGLNTTFATLRNLLFGSEISSMRDINFHNFFFDSSVRFGLPITFIIASSLILAFYMVWDRVRSSRYYTVLLVGMMSNVGLHSTINSALSQSLYVSGLVLSLVALTYCAPLEASLSKQK